MSQPNSASYARGDEGFTLVEVIVAFAIASLAVAVLFETFGGGLMTMRRAHTKADAVLLAHTKLAELSIVTTGTERRRSGTDNGYVWSVTSKAHRTLSGAVWLRSTVTWQPSGQRKKEQVVVTTLQTR